MLSLHTRPRRVFSALVLSLLMTLLVLGMALAHERREVGSFLFVVGWRNEPALVEQPNGLDLRIMTKIDEQPVTGLENSLRAEVIFGDRTMPLELRPRFGQPGAYTADLAPTRPGSYIFHITGQISDTQIDERFNSADGEFSDVEPLASIQFPEPVGTGTELASSVAAARQAADTARTLALVGLAAGVLGLGAGAIALVRR